MADLSAPKKPSYKRGSAESPSQGQLPYGAATNLNAQSPGQAPAPFPDLENRPFTDDDSSTEPLLGPEFDNVLFQPTHRPDEPVTTGSPFGAGANAIRDPGETEATKDLLTRVAESIIGHPALGSSSRAFLARIANGE